MTPDDLRRIGEARYGPRWQTPLAARLGRTPRLLRYYASGDREIPPELRGELADMLDADAAELARLAATLRRGG